MMCSIVNGAKLKKKLFDIMKIEKQYA